MHILLSCITYIYFTQKKERMNMTLRLDTEALRLELIKLFDEKPLSLHKHAINISITQHTLINFIYKKRITSRITYVKIKSYIEHHKARMAKN